MQITYKGKLDLATMAGIGGAVAILITALLMGGNPQAFFNVPSMLIVGGGTFFATLACFSFADIVKTCKVVTETLFKTRNSPLMLSINIIETAQLVRGNNFLRLDGEIEHLRKYPIFYDGMICLMDSMPPDELLEMMKQKITSANEQNMKATEVLRQAAQFAPAMGLIGTLIGLIQMLGVLDDPSKIGAGMAVALITTFYGAVIAYLILSPLASKFEMHAREEMMINQLSLLGTASIARGDNPRRTEMLLNTVLPPAKHVQYFES